MTTFTMRLFAVLLVFCTSALYCGAEENPEDNEVKVEDQELKIEVITNAETCERKTDVGDILHVHYNGTLENGQIFDAK